MENKDLREEIAFYEKYVNCTEHSLALRIKASTKLKTLKRKLLKKIKG